MKIFFEDLFCAPAEFRSIGPMAFTTAVVENMNKPKTRKLKAFKETPEEKKLAKLKKIKEKQVCSLIPFLILVDVLEVENDWSAK